MEHLHRTPPRPSTSRATIDANARTTVMLTPAPFVSSAVEQQDVAAVVEENVASAEFRDDDGLSLSSVESSEHRHHTPPRPSSHRAGIDANAHVTDNWTPLSFVSSAARQQVVVAVEEIVANVEFSDDDSLSLSSVESCEAEELECCICLEEPSANNVTTIDGCEHKFCIECIIEWSETNNVCPLCRTRFTAYESAGGILQQVPDRRPVAAASINLVRLFNLEEIAVVRDESNEEVFVAMRQRSVEPQEEERQERQILQQLAGLLLQQNGQMPDQMTVHFVDLSAEPRAEEVVEQGTEGQTVEQAAEEGTEGQALE